MSFILEVRQEADAASFSRIVKAILWKGGSQKKFKMFMLLKSLDNKTD